METQDLAFPLLRNIEVCTQLADGMKDASAVIFLEDEDSPEADESRDEFLRNTGERFKNYANILDDVALSHVRVSASRASGRKLSRRYESRYLAPKSYWGPKALSVPMPLNHFLSGGCRSSFKSEGITIFAYS